MKTLILLIIIAFVSYYIYYLISEDRRNNHKDKNVHIQQSATTATTTTVENRQLTPSNRLQKPLTPSTSKVKTQDNPNAKVQKLKYFCIKDKGYHVSVWPKDHDQFDIVEFSIAGITHRENIDNYIGECKGTLEAEPTNPYDTNAIKVLAHDGHHLGYVPKEITFEVRRHFSLPCACYIFIGKNDNKFYSDCYAIIR